MDHDELLALARQIVRGRARRAGLDDNTADDLSQELLVKYLRAWPGADEPDNPAAWLQHAAGNVVIDHVRQGQRKPVAPMDDGADDSVASLIATLRAAGTPSLVVINHDVWQAALDLVPSGDAEVLRRRFMDGVPAADLAADLGISRAAVDQRTARAKTRMRYALVNRPDLVAALQSGHQHAYQSDPPIR